MKKVTTFFASLCTTLAVAQAFYNPSVKTETYSQLTNGIKQYEYPGNPGLYLLSLPKPMMFFNQPTDSSLTIGAGGYIVTRTSTRAMAIDPFLADMLEGANNSGIFIEFDSSSVPNRLSVEWRNMVPQGHSAGEYVNFIAHLYSDQSVEFHYGPTQMTGTAAFNGKPGPSVFLILFDNGFSTWYEYHKMIGSPSNPSFGKAPTNNTLTGIPAEGTLYRYEPFNIGLNEQANTPFKLYPNPVQNKLIIEDIPADSKVEITALDGSSLIKTTLEINSLNVEGLSPGTYLLRIEETDGHIHHQKFIKL